MLYLTNSFSINMLKEEETLTFSKVSAEEVVQLILDNEIENCIGHADTDNIVRGELERHHHRYKVKIPRGERKTITPDFETDLMVVAQYTGPRLPEGCTELPEGAEITFWLVTRSTADCPYFCGV